MKPGRQSTKGYAQGSDLSVDRCASYELDGDARHNKVFIQVRPPWGRNTYVLRLICIATYNKMCWDVFWGGPLPALYSPGGRVTNLETNPSWLQLP
jgi:hypothetical protein